MDSIFVLGEDARAAFLRHMMHSFGSDYICLWSYSPHPSNCLVCLDGFYDEEKIQQPSSSSGTLATTLFNAYCGSLNFIDNECVPGFAFKNKVPYLEVKLDYIIPAMLTTQAQMQLYQEAEIKTAVFMGCAAGEIELGFSTQPRVNLQMEIERSWFPADFSTQTSFDSSSKNPAPSIYLDNKNIPISSCFITVSSSRSEANNILQETVAATSVDSTLTQIPEQQQFPAALLMPILSPRPPLSSHHTALNNHRAAFTPYCAASAPPLAAAPPTHDAHNRSSFFARSLSLLRNLDMMRRSTIRHDDELTMQNLQGNHHTQIRHVIAERKRRHKLNHSFQILRTLLVPQLFKKDKASILSITAKYLSSLRSQMGELKRRNAMLEMQLSSRAQRSESRVSEELQIHPSTETRVVVGVEIAPYASSTSEEATSSLVLDLRVSLRSRECSLCELVAGILRFLKHHYTNHVTLLSLQSSTRIVESTPVHVLVLTLKVEGDGFDESGFQEAVRRVVDDLPH